MRTTDCDRDLPTVFGPVLVIYAEGKAGLIESALFGKLIHALNVLQNLNRGVILEQRLEARTS